MSPRGDTVILLHGLVNRPFMVKRIEWRLRRDGYRVINWGYPSRNHLIEEHAAQLDGLMRTVGRDAPIHFVGFSLGALVIRYYLSHYDAPRNGRFVMIAPPNRGSENVDALYSRWWFRMIFGTQSVRQLHTSNRAFFEQLDPPGLPFGIIAGGLGDGRGFSSRFPGDNDGAVSVDSTRLDGAADFILLRCQHTMLLFAKTTSHQTAHFLRHGRFDHQREAPNMTGR
jgi:pimeloyl-ACP methyl ester carboxylesterase